MPELTGNRVNSMSVNWADLPPDLLDTISRSLPFHSDYLHFRATCQAWRQSSSPHPSHLPIQFPWLMLPPSHHSHHRRYFFRLLDNKFHSLPLPEASFNRRRCGSSLGYLIILDQSPNVFLINILTRERFNLPGLDKFPNVTSFNWYKIGREYTLRSNENEVFFCSLVEMRDTFIKKVVLSESPKENVDFVALAVLNMSGDLAYCRGGGDCWKLIRDANSHCEDVICYKGLFYGVDKFGTVVVIDVSEGEEEPRLSYIETIAPVNGDIMYLVKPSDDELWLVARNLELEVDIAHLDLDIAYKTFQFCVYALKKGENGPLWEKVESLGDKVLFLGENSSLVLSASDYAGFKGNRIYFTDDYSETNYDGVLGDHDMGIYNMEDGSIEVLPCYPRSPHARLRWPPPIWITPSPN